jgi:endonuclease/exonuclease/phosphatase family metal-dependent hydrolase
MAAMEVLPEKMSQDINHMDNTFGKPHISYESKTDTTVIVKSWNVLHIIHELNYASGSSAVLDKYMIETNPLNETNRLQAIYQVIIKALSPTTIMCLQEVPEDLSILFDQEKDYVKYVYMYKRVPRLKINLENHNNSPSEVIGKVYTNNGESLVIIVHKSMIRDNTTTHCVQFDDPGKACLVLKINDLFIMNVHMPIIRDNGFSNAIKCMVKFLNNFDKNMKYIIVGDMNTSSSIVTQILGTYMDDFNVILYHGMSRKFRKFGKTMYSQLDHIIVSNDIQYSNFVVYPNVDMSDHMMISVDIKIKIEN